MTAIFDQHRTTRCYLNSEEGHNNHRKIVAITSYLSWEEHCNKLSQLRRTLQQAISVEKNTATSYFSWGGHRNKLSQSKSNNKIRRGCVCSLCCANAPLCEPSIYFVLSHKNTHNLFLCYSTVRLQASGLRDGLIMSWALVIMCVCERERERGRKRVSWVSGMKRERESVCVYNLLVDNNSIASEFLVHM